MNRRYFIKAGALLTGIAGALPGGLNKLLARDNSSGVLMKSGTEESKAELRIISGIHYIPVVNLAEFLDSVTYLNTEKRKFVFRFREQRVIVTVDNSFVLINSIPYQMPVSVRKINGKIYVPVAFLAELINNYCPVNLDYSRFKRTLTLKLTDVNITGIEIEQRANGTLIHIPAIEPFLKKGLSADIRNGWLAIDILGGKIDIESIKRTPVSGIISKIDAFQFKESCSIQFKLKKPIVYRDVIQDEQSHEILVSIRTDEDLKHKVNESTRENLEAQKKRWFIDTIIIDPGHGGKDPGALGVDKKYNEKDVVLAIGLQLRKLLKHNLPGVKVIMTRDKDVFIPLTDRTHIANRNKGKLFISIHANSNRKRTLGGFETYILGESKGERATDVALKENSVIQFEGSSAKKKYEGINLILATMAQSAFLKQSQYFAAIVQDELDARLSAYKMKNRGVKQGVFWVMVGASMPNILVETGFISNRKEYKLLKKDSVQKQIASAIFAGIDKYKEDIERTI
jgi:N-acetylmuramoyl-L-alanine amidase